MSRGQTRKLTDLVPDPENRRKHNPRNIAMVVDALQSVGAARSIVIDEDNVVLAGNGVVEAAAAAGITKLRVIEADGQEVIAVRRSGLTADQKRTLAIYDNRSAELAEWDAGQLAKDAGAGLEMGRFWTFDELEAALKGTAKATGGQTEPDAIPAPRTTAIARGDVFELGAHRLICGDSTNREDVARVLAGERIDLVVTSPPYNVNIKYRSHKDRADRETYLLFIASVANAFIPHMAPGRFVAWNLGVSPKTFPHHQVVTLEDCGLTFYRQIVWAKSGVAYPIFPSTMRTRRIRHYKPNYTHEVIQVFESADEQDVPTVACRLCEGVGQMAVREIAASEKHETVQLLTYGDDVELGATNEPSRRYSSDLWHISQSQATQGLKTVATEKTAFSSRNGSHRVKEHPAAFPVELPRAVMSFLAGEGEVVFEPFGGSGSTLIACEQMKRRARLVEIDPVYCQIVVDRWEDFTGKTAVKVGDARS